MYNNELFKDGKNRGFWLINVNGEKTPLYYTHKQFYQESRLWLEKYVVEYSRMPSKEEFMKAALEFDALK